MVLDEVDDLQLRSQILRMISSNSRLLHERLEEYVSRGGRYGYYYQLLQSTNEEQLQADLQEFDIRLVPPQVRMRLREILSSSPPSTSLLTSIPSLIELELNGIIKRAQAILGRARTGCC